MKKVRVHLKERSYDIIICSDKLDKLGLRLKHLKIGKDAFIITNPLIKKLFGNIVKKGLTSSGFNVTFEAVPDSERAKSEKYCIRLLQNLSRLDSTKRRIFIIALGGGVVGDLAGFTASIYRRGVPYIQVPTTLLAQVDSAIGGKVAIDLKAGKNLAGSFYQPRLVYSDVSLLKRLPKREILSGLSEVIKYGVIKSPTLFNFVEKNYKKLLRYDKASLEFIVCECSKIKASVVEKDELDNKNIRVILNLGHTIGHAIEAASKYRKIYSHGEAVALGMRSSIYISEKIGLLKKIAALKIESLIKKVGLPTTLKSINLEDIISAQEHDKKFIHGKNRLVVPVKIGKVKVIEGVSKLVVKKSIEILYESKG